MKVKCISTKSGFHQRLERGKWYDAEEYESRGDGNKDNYIIRGLGNKQHKLDMDYGVYDKSLFITLEEHRDKKINKILN